MGELNGQKQSNSQSSNSTVKGDETLESCVRESPKGNNGLDNQQ